MLLEIEKILVEGVGVVGLVVLVCYLDCFCGKCVGLVLLGGNIDLLLLIVIIECGMVCVGCLVCVKVSLCDVFGILVCIIGIVVEVGVNIDEVYY